MLLLGTLGAWGQAINISPLAITCLEGSGAQSFTFSWGGVPVPTSGNLVISVSVNAGTTEGNSPNDYFMQFPTGQPFGATITIPLTAGATVPTLLQSLRVLPQNDGLVDGDNIITFTIISVPPGMSIGASSSATLTIVDVNGPTTVLDQGDLAIVGVNANNYACSTYVGEDEISFFCFQDITPNTQLIITDNGFERVNAGQWGNSEGTVRMTRTGTTIPAGTVITFHLRNTLGTGNVVGISPDALWSCANLGLNPVNLNNGGDQLFFMQGGVWNNGTTSPTALHNATYSGTVLYGFSTNGQFLSFGNSTQQSGLPTSMECFSMAPTSATDYTKYTGPITGTTKRGWLIRIDDPTDWTTYASCSAYSSGAPDWTAAPVLPITLNTFVPGLWTGYKTTDWFDCRNWDDAKVPVAATNVLIDQTAIRSCVVTGATAATCFDLSVQSDGASRFLYIDNGMLNAGGDMLVQRTAGSGAFGAQLQNTSTLTVAGSVTIQGTAPGLQDAYLRDEYTTSTIDVNGDITVEPGGFLDLSGGGLSGGTLYLAGDFNNNAGEADFDDANSTVVLDGNGAQTINGPSFTDRFGVLRVNKSANDVFVTDGFIVRKTLDLQQGRVMNSALVSLLDNATAINYSDASFVNGQLEKIGNDNFVFPVGKGNKLRTIAISGLTATATDAFTAAYFDMDPQSVYGNTLDPTLDHISSCEYWILDQSAGTPNAYVTLSWDTPSSCGVTLLPDLRVARYDGSVWRDRGNGGTTGNTTAGTIITAAQQNAFSPWTLASVSGAENPLPIELLYFRATPGDHVVALDWATATERNNERFIVERSADASSFQPIGEVPGAINSQEMRTYGLTDDGPLPGFSYYRLAQRDLDGTTTRSDVVSVYMHAATNGTVIVVADGQLQADHHLTGSGSWQLYDTVGRIVRQGALDGTGRTVVGIADLPAGAYTFRAEDASGLESGRFIR